MFMPLRTAPIFIALTLIAVGLLGFSQLAQADITTGLVGHWTFDNTTNDSSGQGNNGTFNGGTPQFVAGQFSPALSLAGSNDYINAGSNSSILPSSFTVSAWIRSSSMTTNAILVSFGGTIPAVYLNGTGEGNPLLYMGSNNFRYFYPASSLGDGQWHHVVFTMPGNAQSSITGAKMFVDGTEISSGTTVSSGGQSSKTSFKIGDSGFSDANFNGLIDDVRVYNRALTQPDITELYAWTGGPPPSDTTPPTRSSGQPTGTLPQGTTQTPLSLTTDENATCRYSTTGGTAYSSMTNTFSSTGGANHSTSATGLTDGQSYTYYVRCIDSASNANTADFAISFSVAAPDTQAPTTPTSPAAAAVSQSQINLSWTASTDAVGVTNYRIRRCQGTSCTPSTVLTTIGNTTSYSDSALTANTTYRYTISALDAAGNESNQSSIATATTLAPDTTDPSIPTNLSATAVSLSQIDLSWTASTDPVIPGQTTSGVTGYRVFRDDTQITTP